MRTGWVTPTRIPSSRVPFPQPCAPAPPCGPLPAEPGMLFEFHPNLFVPSLCGGAVGDMVVVTEAGHRNLTTYISRTGLPDAPPRRLDRSHPRDVKLGSLSPSHLASPIPDVG